MHAWRGAAAPLLWPPASETSQPRPATLLPPLRGFQPTGKLAVILERCIVDVVRFISLYVLWNIGFTLAFFTMTVRGKGPSTHLLLGGPGARLALWQRTLECLDESSKPSGSCLNLPTRSSPLAVHSYSVACCLSRTRSPTRTLARRF